jgi:predicted AAA+ superfamily ATPase
MYIPRHLERLLIQYHGHFPAIGILGPRQAGKTTLAKKISPELDKETLYLDLENPSDRGALLNPIEFFNTLKDKTIIIDEVQRLPELFPVLRSAIDRHRVPGRFIILGSASRELITLSNETLAGRIVYSELTPFFLDEIINISGFRDHWLRGGFPDAFKTSEIAIRNLWMKSFISAYVERDLMMLGLGSSPGDIERILYMLAGNHGNLMNYSSLSNSLGLHINTVKNIISFFEKSFIIRILQPWYSNIGKRLVKTPKVYIRDSGIVNHLLGFSDYEDLLRYPTLGNLWEGYVIENIINSLGDEYRYFFYRTADGAESDLLIFKGLKCVAALDPKFSPVPHRTRSMTVAINDVKPLQAFFIVPEVAAIYSLSDNLYVATIRQALERIKEHDLQV